VLRRGSLLTSRETGVLAALGIAEVCVIHRPRVAIISTGDELVAPGQPLWPGQVFDSNGTVLADAVRELGGEPVPFGIVADDRAALRSVLRDSLACDAVLLSGGTSKGAGDLSYQAVGELGPPGIVVHGVALKPGKPLCLAVVKQHERRPVPVVVLPGFPTSAIFTFREFIAPVLRCFAGRTDHPVGAVEARMPMRVNSERGRTEYLLVSLVAGESTGQLAYPLGQGSGSVTAFGRADGFVAIPRQREYLEYNELVTVNLLAADVRAADLVVIGSHCTGLDYLIGELSARGLTSKVLAVGSTGGLEAAKRGECDVAGVHLLDAASDTYNRPFLTDALEFLSGYGRLQGIVFRPGDNRFEGQDSTGAMTAALADGDCVLVNRNRGSGTRVLIDRLLGAARPPGYMTEVRSHNAVVAAVAQGRADWGVAIAPVARAAGLGFLPLRAEQYDFVVPKLRRDRPAVRMFAALLTDAATRQALAERGFLT
jgi:putative molybdopterin biosynthesis protein